MEILIKVVIFCGIAGALVIIAAVATEILMRYYPRIVRKILGE